MLMSTRIHVQVPEEPRGSRLPLELEFQAFVRFLPWVLGIEL